ncbi:hypothetical protein Cgig2_004030 [Carnegiea gigantea]|uniref:VOC domain-containing protein n=1 Tax=Carnegiea gigantea TaxID=171969 RepID=A0A9Q1KTU8_9CARY|nr:hypothetical protein Cgig2_004030 [Carnegiea gigantea]
MWSELLVICALSFLRIYLMAQSSVDRNSGLYGSPLSKMCRHTDEAEGPPMTDNDREMNPSWLTGSSGFIVGKLYITDKYHAWFMETFGRMKSKRRMSRSPFGHKFSCFPTNLVNRSKNFATSVFDRRFEWHSNWLESEAYITEKPLETRSLRVYKRKLNFSVRNHYNNSTRESGHVVGLDLSRSCLYGALHWDSTLFTLTHLQHLDLSDNNFNRSPIPSQIGNLSNLRSLHLTGSALDGQIPSETSKLSQLISLDLSYNKGLRFEYASWKKLLQNLTHLETLSLDAVDISSPIPVVLANLSLLQYVSFQFCNLYGQFPTSIFSYLILKLLIWPIPSLLGNLTNLIRLDLSHNDFSVASKELISWLVKLNQLNHLILVGMNLGGEIPSFLSNLTDLIYLDLSHNHVTGQIPNWLMNLTHLLFLSLEDNQLNGLIPSEANSQLADVATLSFNDNANLCGNFDTFLKLKNLVDLHLSGVVKLTFWCKNVGNVIVPKFQSLYLSSCNLTEFPWLLHNQDELEQLDLSNNNIHGVIPQWFLNVTRESLYMLDLSQNFFTAFEQPVVSLPWGYLETLNLKDNHLQDSLPIPPSSIVIYQVSNNEFVGDIPRQICNASLMEYFDISFNNLSGQIPSCINVLRGALSVLNLKGNNFSGTVPRVFPASCNPGMIDLSENQLQGRLPKSLTNCNNLAEQKEQHPLPLMALNHVSRLCRSVKDSMEFYTNVLGFVVIERPHAFDSFDGAWLFNYGIGIHLVQSQDEQQLPSDKQGLDPMDNHISFQCDDMEAMEQKLKDFGVNYMKRTVEDKDNNTSIDQLFFNDPDGFMQVWRLHENSLREEQTNTSSMSTMGSWSYQYYLLFSVLLVNSALPSYTCHDHERSALLQFKHSFSIDCAASFSPAAYPKVNSWGIHRHNADCCSWDGVYCNEETLHVIGLDLSSSCLYGSFPSNITLFNLTHLRHLSLSDNYFNLSEIPSEIGQFSKLVSLNLSDSAFNGQIPLAISNFSSLSTLDLSNQLEDTKDGGQLKLQDPSLEKLVRNLTRLKELYLDQVDISSFVPDILTNLTLLEEVSLRVCNLNGQFPTNIFHLPHLEMLYVSGNIDLMGFLPEFQQNSPLKHLGLSMTSFHGELPSSIGELANLEDLNLWECLFSGPLPSSLGNLTKLTSLELGGSNAFSGDLPSSLINLTEVHWLGLSHLQGRHETLMSWLFNLNKLASLSLDFINLGGEIPSVISNLTGLTRLALSNNGLTGGIPHWLMNLTQLNLLSLPGNQLEGPIFSSGISQLENLDLLWLDNNRNLHGDFDAFLKLKYLRFMNLAGVKLAFLGKNTANESVPKLNMLNLNSCNLREFPQFLRSQDALEDLDLGSNNIHGFIPRWFINITQETLYSLSLSNNLLTGFEQPVMFLPWSRLESLSLRGNRLQGSLPIPPRSMVIYQVSDNQLAGSIPPQICQAGLMNYFDASNNKLSGRIPDCMSQLSNALTILNLERNNLHGNIPATYPESCNLRWIDLNGNRLEGSMPRSLANCENLEVLDVGHNHINDTFPSWLGGLSKLHILVLRHNHFHGILGRPKVGHDFHSLHIIDLSNNFHTGDLPLAYLQNWDAMKHANESGSIAFGTRVEIYVRMPGIVNVQKPKYNYSITITNKGNDRQYPRVLTVFRVIDFSSNNFTGRIPNFVGELRGLQVLNLSNNNLQGGIPLSLANIAELESLDLSNNRLSGEIPPSLTQLTFLEVFNVSHNLLKGPIPQGRQFGTFDSSSFSGNLGLCGNPLSQKCGNAFEPPPAAITNDGPEEDSMLIDWIVRSLGYISGFAVGCALGKYFTDRNHEWFVETFQRRKRGSRSRAYSVVNSSGSEPHCTDCCLWDVVYCDEETSHVTELDNKRCREFVMSNVVEQIASVKYNNLTSKGFMTEFYNCENLLLVSASSPGKIKLFPINIFHLPLLEKLYLVGNPDIAGSLPEFQQKSPLRELDLSETSFQGDVPSSIGQLAHLEELKLYNCDLSGPPLSSLGNLTKLNSLDLRSKTAFSGDLPSSLANLSQLQFGLSNLNNSPERLISFLSNQDKLTAVLSLNFINLDAEIPSVIANITSLTFLDLEQNQLTGRIPHWLVNLTQLNVLSLLNNQLKGPILLPGISQLPNLYTLLLGGNHNLNGNFDGFLKLKNLRDLHLSGVTLTFGGENATNESVSKLIALDLSSCNLRYLTSQISKCIRELSRSLVVLNLEGNKFHGTIPLPYPKSCKLKIINLRGNQLEGRGLPKLYILVLRYNPFHGKAGRPNARFSFHSLRIIDLYNNFHTGDLPFAYLQNWDDTKSLNENNSNKSRSAFPLFAHMGMTIAAMPLQYDYLITISNKGNDMWYTKILIVFRVIDFSGNNFTGTIPSCIGGLQALNLSNNDLQGEIPPSLVHMTDLESLNLFNNKLSGEIPQGLTQLTFLKRCGNAFEPSPPNAVAESNTDGGDSMLIDWIIRCLGCVSGFAVSCAFRKYLTDRNREWFVETIGTRNARGARTRGRRATRPRILLVNFALPSYSCHDHERSALLQFKHSFIIDCSPSFSPAAYPKVNSWGVHRHNGDCCSWDVAASAAASLPTLPSSTLPISDILVSVTITSIFLKFPQRSLLSLDLSDSAFNGQIPLAISNFSALSTLDLSNQYEDAKAGSQLKLQDPSLEKLVRNMTSLKELYLDQVDISSFVPDILTNLTLLEEV